MDIEKRKGRIPRPPRPPGDTFRYGIGEWFGYRFDVTPQEQRMALAERQALRRSERPSILCPFQSYSGRLVNCTKESGVCTIRQYRLDSATQAVEVAEGPSGRLRTLCPRRFVEDGVIFRWIGETILKHPDPLVVKEVKFLQRPVELIETEAEREFEDVGRIDHVLIHPDNPAFEWCALEIQAVYFSGDEMGQEFTAIRENPPGPIPFPVGRRRPDDRSSGPKRLMPQLQTKVPSLRRWGKKMAVIIDEGFFDALGRMDSVPHVSNCDIAWFIVGFEEQDGRAVLTPRRVQLTTLERAVEGLTGGEPVSREEFERRIQEKLASR